MKHVITFICLFVLGTFSNVSYAAEPMPQYCVRHDGQVGSAPPGISPQLFTLGGNQHGGSSSQTHCVQSPTRIQNTFCETRADWGGPFQCVGVNSPCEGFVQVRVFSFNDTYSPETRTWQTCFSVYSISSNISYWGIYLIPGAGPGPNVSYFNLDSVNSSRTFFSSDAVKVTFSARNNPDVKLCVLINGTHPQFLYGLDDNVVLPASSNIQIVGRGSSKWTATIGLDGLPTTPKFVAAKKQSRNFQLAGLCQDF